MRLGNPEKYTSDGKDVAPFVELVERRKPDVVAVSGWSVETRRLYKDLQDIVERHSLQGTPYEDPEDDREVSDPLEIMMVNDEVARLYHTSARASMDHPSVPPLTRYSIALAMYMQNPMKEYAALGRDIISVSFDPNQHLLPEEKLIKALDSAMVDMVNLVGIDINDAVNDNSTANLLPYVSGLGPRKAAQMLRVVNSWGADVGTRDMLTIGDSERGLKPAVGPKCWTNCASFLYIMYEATENDTDYLDNTRIHPEDYDVARKIAADALEFDEEDIKTEVDQNGPAAVVRRLVADDAQDKVNDLLLDEYAGQLEVKFGQKKRATLELIRAELQNPFEELRRNFEYLTTNEAFTMMTGETPTSLLDGMIIPVSVKKTFSDHVEVKLDCGVDGSISSSEFPDEVINNNLEPRQVWAMHQTIRAKITHIDRKKLHAQLTLRDNEMDKPFRRDSDHDYGKSKSQPSRWTPQPDEHFPEEWDHDQEAKDQREAKRATQKQAGRIQRVVKHSLFRPYNSHQAEAELSLPNVQRGDCIIRPSSKGTDHLAVTWKVHDNVYQHIDVLELNKENEYSVGRTLRVGKFTYSDLDELIVLHVKAMAKKVDEMCGDEKYQNLSKEALGMLQHAAIWTMGFEFSTNTYSQRRGSPHTPKPTPGTAPTTSPSTPPTPATSS
jgi:transcription elongation factor SPT6